MAATAVSSLRLTAVTDINVPGGVGTPNLVFFRTAGFYKDNTYVDGAFTEHGTYGPWVSDDWVRLPGRTVAAGTVATIPFIDPPPLSDRLGFFVSAMSGASGELLYEVLSPTGTVVGSITLDYWNFVQNLGIDLSGPPPDPDPDPTAFWTALRDAREIV